jgi:hypothetical protein
MLPARRAMRQRASRNTRRKWCSSARLVGCDRLITLRRANVGGCAVDVVGPAIGGVSMGETSPAPDTTIADGVPEAESRVFIALRTKDWLSPADLMGRAAVAEDAARACCERFWQMGLVVRRGASPSFRYRALRVPLHDAGRAYLRSIQPSNRDQRGDMIRQKRPPPLDSCAIASGATRVGPEAHPNRQDRSEIFGVN